MSIIGTIVIGFVIGLIAKVLTPGRDPSGFFITAAIGSAGSVLASYGGPDLPPAHTKRYPDIITSLEF